jgi:hypothetical protein
MFVIIAVAVAVAVAVVFARLQDVFAKLVDTRNYARIDNVTKLVTAKAVTSLLETGGFTISPAGVSPKSGYVVALAGNEVVYGIEGGVLSYEEADSCIASYLSPWRVASVLTAHGAHFGGWVENDRLFLDVSVVVRTEAKAMELGREYRQKAVYCLHTAKTIYVK